MTNYSRDEKRMVTRQGNEKREQGEQMTTHDRINQSVNTITLQAATAGLPSFRLCYSWLHYSQSQLCFLSSLPQLVTSGKILAPLLFVASGVGYIQANPSPASFILCHKRHKSLKNVARTGWGVTNCDRDARKGSWGWQDVTNCDRDEKREVGLAMM